MNIGLYEHTLQWLNDLGYFFVRLPLFLSNHFFADVSILDIRVPNHSFEFEHGEFEGELFGEIEINNKIKALVGRPSRSLDSYFPVEQILFLAYSDLSE